jgi:deazaflavin-dependent oxidoreductase (nitroreductase family)
MPWWIDRTRRLRHHLSRLEVWELERFGRSGLSVISRQSVAVLVTTGRRSGAVRKTPVTITPYAGAFLIGGGAGGQKATPDWVYNLRATPRARLTLRRVAYDCDVEEPTGEERDSAYRAIVSKYPEVGRFEAWGERPLPLFILRPIGVNLYGAKSRGSAP